MFFSNPMLAHWVNQGAPEKNKKNISKLDAEDGTFLLQEDDSKVKLEK